MEYPKHLSEKIREEAAVDYLKHELRKIFPSIKSSEVLELMGNKQLCNPRDFWNGIHGVSMGFKLKNTIYLVTAENIKWERRKMSPSELTFGVELEQTKKVKEGKITGREFMDFYKNNPQERTEQLNKIIKMRGNDEERESDPILAVEKENIISVHDGNGRLARHILEGKNEIEVFVGKMEGKYPTNYWLPTSFLLEYLYYVYAAIDIKDEELFEKQMTVVKNMLIFSESGKIEFVNRALTSKKEYREKILNSLSSEIK